MLECIILAAICLWVIAALVSMKKAKKSCSGDCVSCYSGQRLCRSYYKDNPRRKNESR